MTPGFFARLALAIATWFQILLHPRFAADVLALREKKAVRLEPSLEPKALDPGKTAAAALEPKPRAADPAPALQMLAILQREGRFVDFLEEDISQYADADVGAAARMVHDGCRKALGDYLALEPLRVEGEGARVVVDRGFDPSAVRLTGNVAGDPPFAGTLRHHGWRAKEVKLPPLASGADARVLAPAEVEL